jgi:hypothetical protein
MIWQNLFYSFCLLVIVFYIFRYFGILNDLIGIIIDLKNLFFPSDLMFSKIPDENGNTPYDVDI